MRLLTLGCRTWHVNNRLQQLLRQFIEIRNLENIFFFAQSDLYQLIFVYFVANSNGDDFDTFILCRRKSLQYSALLETIKITKAQLNRDCTFPPLYSRQNDFYWPEVTSSEKPIFWQILQTKRLWRTLRVSCMLVAGLEKVLLGFPFDDCKRLG